MTTVILVQHGEKERVPGDPGLTRDGWDQARRAAVALGELGRPAAVYSSPLKRAAQTASVIARSFDRVVEYDDRLRERINWEGGDAQPIEAFVADWERTTRDRDFTPSSGDSSRRAGDRMLEAISDAAQRHLGGMAVVVTHGGATVDLLRTLLGDDVLVARAPNLLDDGVPCCALTVLTRRDEAWRAEVIAEDAHLSDPQGRAPFLAR